MEVMNHSSKELHFRKHQIKSNQNSAMCIVLPRKVSPHLFCLEQKKCLPDYDSFIGSKKTLKACLELQHLYRAIHSSLLSKLQVLPANYKTLLIKM